MHVRKKYKFHFFLLQGHFGIFIGYKITLPFTLQNAFRETIFFIPFDQPYAFTLCIDVVITVVSCMRVYV